MTSFIYWYLALGSLLGVFLAFEVKKATEGTLLERSADEDEYVSLCSRIFSELRYKFRRAATLEWRAGVEVWGDVLYIILVIIITIIWPLILVSLLAFVIGTVKDILFEECSFSRDIKACYLRMGRKMQRHLKRFKF